MSVTLPVIEGGKETPGAVRAGEVDLAVVREIVARIGGQPEDVVPLLQALQERFHYVPAEALREIAERTQISPAALTGVATFFQQFRQTPAGEHLVRVCHGTACHVQGSERIEEALRRHLGMTAEQDTDATGRYTVERVGCVGCCTLAPVVVTDGTTHGRVRTDAIAAALEVTGRRADPEDEREISGVGGGDEICIGIGSCCAAGGSLRVEEILRAEAAALGVKVRVKGVGCVGMCHQTPMVEVRRRGAGGGVEAVLYTQLKDASEERIRGIVRKHFRPTGAAGWWRKAGRVVAEWAGGNGREGADGDG